MKITPQQSRKCLYPTIAAVTAIVSGVSCSQPAAGQALPGEPPAVQETQPSSKPKDKFNRPKQHVIGKAKIDTPSTEEAEKTVVEWEEQMLPGDYEIDDMPSTHEP